MYELLYQKMKEVIPLGQEEFEFCKTMFTFQTLNKKDYFLREGAICKYTAFINKGLLRTFITDDKGTDHILQFGMEGWWVADLSSFITEETSFYNIEALEDTELLLISLQNWNELLETYAIFERFFRILIQNNLIATQNRLMDSFSHTAMEKYKKLLEQFPNLLQRVPQHLIASYLGITRETLSRIRNRFMYGA